MRYAIYFTPDVTTPLHAFGCAVLGYDGTRGARVPFHPALVATFPDWDEMSEAARKYGFHATLKAPFELADGFDEAALCQAVAELAAQLEPVDAQRFEITASDHFVSLRPFPRDHAGLGALAQTCVETLDRFRAPLTAADRARRRPDALTARQRENLDRWGYPFVASDFAFHMTLTGALPPSHVTASARTLADLYGSFDGGAVVDRVSVCRQDTRKACFRVIATYGLVSAAEKRQPTSG
jgi:2'-5' RNA ligase